MNGKLLSISSKSLTLNNGIFAMKNLYSKRIELTLFFCAFFISTLSFAQVGPVGVNTGIKLWLDASDLDGDGIIEGLSETGLTAGDSVSIWVDKSTVAGNFTVPTGGNLKMPVYKPLEPTFGNLTAVDFGTTSALSHATTSWSGNHTIFIVFKQKTDPVGIGTSIFSSGFGTSGTAQMDDHFRIASDSASGTDYAYYTSTGNGTSALSTESIFGSQSAAASNIKIYTATRSGNNILTYVDGGAPNSVVSAAGGDIFDEYVLNASIDTSLLNDCLIAEVIIYDVVLTGTERQRVQDYLDCKYLSAFADKVPGGIDPCTVSLWLKADGAASTNLNGSNVDDWYDQSNYAFHGNESGGNRPTYIPSDNNFNASINFDDANNDRLDLTSNQSSPAPGNYDALTMGTNDFSIYSVAKADPGLNGTLFSDMSCTQTNGYRLHYTQSTNAWNFDGIVVDGSFATVNSAVAATNNTTTPYSLISFKRSGTLHTIQTNEGGITTGTSSPTLTLSANNSATERWIGRQDGVGSCSSDYFDGNISELIIVRNTVSVIEDKKIQSYLGIKYGLTIPSSLGSYLPSNGSTDLWTFTSHWNDVAGIGQDNGSVLHQRVAKSQHPTAIVTIATDADFTSINDATRTAMGDGNFLLWGNNNTPATTAWAVGGAPNNYAILPEIWRVKKTGTVPQVHLRVDVNDPENDMPGFVGDLYLVHGPDLSIAATDIMTETSPGSGIWELSNITFTDSSYFTFGVRNDLILEFSVPSASSVDEVTLGSFTDVIGTGTVNVPTSFDVNEVGGNANNGGAFPDYTYTDQNYAIDTGTYLIEVFPITAPVLIDDLLEEGNETILFQIVPEVNTGVSIGDVNATDGPVSIHTYTITDDDSYVISIGNATDGIENSTAATFEIFMVSVATNTSGADITGTLTWTGTALDGTDYTSVGAFTILMNAANTIITVPMIDDAFLEGPETIIATIATVVGAVTQTDNDVATIIDDELSSVEISIGSPINQTEGSGNVSFTVSMGATNETASPITGTVTYLTGTAVDGSDFTGVGTFSIAPGASVGTVTPATIADNLVENTESVIAIISSPSVGVVHSTAFTDTAYIYDEDTTGLTISITSGITTILENNAGGTIDYLVELDGTKINGTGADITGTVTLTGTATTPADYTNATVFTFAIPDGATSVVVPINLVDDGVVEPTQTVIATISALSIGTPNLTNNDISVTILDDDAGGQFISIGSPTDTTESPIGAPFVSFSVFIEGGGLNTTGVPITGNITYSGTAVSPLDFTAVPTFSIPVGVNFTIVQVPVIDNTATEPTETVVAVLNGVPSSGNYANLASSATIYDDDASNLLISINSPVNGEEGFADISFVIGLDGGATNFTGVPIIGTINYGGTAVASDYGAPTTFSIADGQSQVTINVTVNDDNFVEIDETVIAILSNPSVGGISTSDSSTAIIVDNDEASLTISIDTPVNATEGGPDELSFLISMSGGLINGLGTPLQGTVTFTGTATPLDFAVNGTFSIPDGSGSIIHSMGVVDDLSMELTDTVIATISAPDAGTIGALSSDTALIFDNDYDFAEINIATTTEGIELPIPVDGVFTISLANGLINETGTDITGTLTISGTASPGFDYATGPSTFTIPNTTSETIITLTVLDDILEEITETVIGTISLPSLGIIGTANSATVTILDDDTDSDHDGLPDLTDPNTGNIDADCDGIFDGCDADADGDGIIDPGLIDTDGDGIEDGCDAFNDLTGVLDNGPDINGDGLNDVAWDPTDSDNDLLPDHVDPNDNNPDTDGDGIPDGADVDVDGDGINDNGCDVDGDGIHNVADSDDTPNDNVTDTGNLDEDADGIDNAWDLVNDNAGGQAVNYIVSPNGDNVNETLRIQGVQFFDNHELIIFDRWGSPVFISNDYQNDWFGEINQGIGIGSENLPEGVYFYTLDLGNGEAVVRGFIEIRI